MDDADAAPIGVGNVADRRPAAVDFDRTCLGQVDAAQDLDQG